MEEMPHCVLHPSRLVEYVCPACKNLPLCETCKLEHAREAKHALENCKEVGLAIIRQRIQCSGVGLAKPLTKRLRTFIKNLEAGLLLEIDRFQSSCVQTDEICKMQTLDREGRYAELYFYGKGLPADGAKNEAVIKELNKRLLNIIDTASDGLKKMLSRIVAAALHKPVFAAYNKDEVLVIEGGSYDNKEMIFSALHGADMSKFKAAYINPCSGTGDRAASELASCIRESHVSALYLRGWIISDAGAKVLAQAAFSKKSLSAFCICGSYISGTGVKEIADAARNCRSLTTFHLSGNNITDAGAKAVAEAVKDCPISTFCFESADISNSGAIAVTTTMKGCPLSAFCLGGGQISDSGAIAVTEAMKNCPLSVFSLSSSQISDTGAAAVAEILSSSGCFSTLSTFYLFSRMISDLGAKKVADAAKSCPLLSSFYIDSDWLSGETVTYILEGMASTSTIRSVNLNGRNISKEQMDSCLDRLRQSGAGRQLRLRLRCKGASDRIVCKKLAAKRSWELAEFRIVQDICDLFKDEVLLGVPK
ncbi:MAG: hypothetical protein P4L50_16505 [Anaerolineaceae bacterium]|nr:hypothetical protein [Anaerolineaceae bacterium]